MNRNEKIIAILLGVILAGYLFWFRGGVTNDAAADTTRRNDTAAVAGRSRETSYAKATEVETGDKVSDSSIDRSFDYGARVYRAAEQTAVLENDELRLEVTTHGGGVKSATLKKYAQNLGEVSEDNPAYKFDFSLSPLGAGEMEYESVAVDGTTAKFFSAAGERTVTLLDGYRVEIAGRSQGTGSISLGVVSMGSSKNDILSVDAWDLGGKKPHVVHYSETDPLKGYLAGSSGGCSGSANAAGMPKNSPAVEIGGNFGWIALKNRFFVAALCETSARVTGFATTVARDTASAKYRPESVAVRAAMDDAGAATKCVFFIGPKKQALLSELGMRDVMEFGMWRWICYPIVWTLNLFHGWIPNYGVAIILLTILVRLLFWPLTHKSTVGMKKMQEIQPLMKEVQAKYKDNPQRLQQETMRLYREHKVNPLSSCLPMLVQIPVFIALFNVLRSAVELRYASFLWIADLSEPEGLFADVLPFGGLNILPILMAATMALQSALTPQAGDKNQQRMMIVMMPVMMLVMFYNFPSALSLYWTLSQVLSIVQMWIIRRNGARGAAAAVRSR